MGPRAWGRDWWTYVWFISRWSVLIDFISVTTIAGPLGEDEEEIGEEFDEDEPSSDEDETIDDEDETGHEEVPGHQEDSPTSVSSPSKFFAEDEESDSDIEVTGVTYIAKDLKITNKSLTPGKLHSPRKLKSPNKNSTVFAEDDDSDSDSDIEITGVTYIPKSLKITNKLLTPVKKNSPMKPKTLVENTSLSTPSKNRSFLTPSKNTSFREKFMSPKVSSSIGNKSLLTPKKNESSLLNLTCESCGNDTEYSINMGVQEEEEKFQVRTNKANIFPYSYILLSSVTSACSPSTRTARRSARCAGTRRRRWRRGGRWRTSSSRTAGTGTRTRAPRSCLTDDTDTVGDLVYKKMLCYILFMFIDQVWKYKKCCYKKYIIWLDCKNSSEFKDFGK